MNRQKRKGYFIAGLFLAFVMAISASGLSNLNFFAATADVKDGENYVGRVYDEDYDVRIDDFNRTEVAADGVTSDLAVTSYNRLLVDYTAAIGNNMEASVYKSGSGINADGAYRYLIFDITGTNGAVLADLQITFAFQDTYFITKNVSEILPISDAGFEFDGTNQLLRIDFNAFEATDLMVHKDQPETTYPFDSKIERLHLITHTGSGNGTLEIREVYFSHDGTHDADQFVTIDNFSNPNLAQPFPGTYWRGSVGTVINQYLIADAGSYVKTFAVTQENLVLKARTVGTVALSIKDSAGTVKTWAELLGPDGEAVPVIAGADFMGYVIDLEASGLLPATTSIEIIAASGDADNYVYIDDLFTTNMEVEDTAEGYPALDSSDIVMWDTFNRERAGANAAYVADDPYALSVNMGFIVSYNNLAKVSVENNALVFDATSLGATDHIHYGASATAVGRNDGSYKYVVFKVKGTDGATLDNFRFNVINSADVAGDIKYPNQLISDVGFAVPSLSAADYPYTDAQGYKYLIVDLALSGLSTEVNGFNIYYSGAGKLYIDSIFFADRLFNLGEDIDEIGDTTERIIDTAGYVYQYIGGADVNQRRYLALEMKSDGIADFSSVRIQAEGGSGNTVWFKDGGWYGLDGLKFKDTLSTEYQTFYIDLEMSGLGMDFANLHGHFGGFEGSTGNLYLRRQYFVDINSIDYENPVFESAEERTVTFTETGYVYGFGVDVAAESKRYMSVEMKGTEGTDLNTIRYEFKKGTDNSLATYWFKDSVYMTIGGRPLDTALGTEYKTYIFDLQAMGLSDLTFDNIHLHSGATGEAGTLNVRNIKFFNNYKPEDSLTALDAAIDSQAPVVTIEANKTTAKVGEEITLNVTAIDNKSAAADITVTYTVTLQSDNSEITVTDNKFTPTLEGTYVVTATAVDEAGNISAIETKEIVVSAEEEPEPEPKGCAKGCNSAAGSIAGVGLIALMAIFLSKKKKTA